MSAYSTPGQALKLRLKQRGGGAAHLDSVLLGGSAPTRIAGLPRTAAAKKLAAGDLDVIDVSRRTIELTFPADVVRPVLRVTGRVEGKKISTIPFQFPAENLYKKMSENSRFYGYRLNSAAAVDTKQKPLFKEYSQTGSGHPSGYTYGWVANDENYLYASIDFTPDNTMDGPKDYAKVYVKTDAGLKEFKASVPETKWGRPSFTYTDKVDYQHKTYDFKIPLAELGSAANIKDLQLAFAAYGTASAGDTAPALAFDPVRNRYLAVYVKAVDFSYGIYGRLIDPQGAPLAAEFPITDSAAGASAPSVAFDEAAGRYLVVWQDMRNASDDAYGQIVNADGTLYDGGTNFPIADNGANTFAPAIAFDDNTGRFLVAWEDDRNGGADIYGQPVNSSGTLLDFNSDTNFPISNAADDQYQTAIAAGAGQFLVAWSNIDGLGETDVRGQLVSPAGAPIGPSNFAIADAASTSQREPSVAYNETAGRFLVAFGNDGDRNANIHGQLIEANGVLYGSTSFTISNYSPSQSAPSAAWDSASGKFLVVWQEFGDGEADIYGQFVDSGGSPYGTDASENFVIDNTAGAYKTAATIGANTVFGNLLTAYQSDAGGLSEIGFGLVDITLPVTQLSTIPSAPNGDNGWFKTVPTVSLATNEPSTRFYSWVSASGPWTEYTGAAFSAPQGANRLYYFSIDTVGNPEAVNDRLFKVDSLNPVDPLLSSPGHPVGGASNDPTIQINLSGASDAASGVDAYSVRWEQWPTALPDTIPDLQETAVSATSPSLADGLWFFSLRTKDNAGNWTSTRYYGPTRIDTVKPSATVASPKYSTSVNKTDNFRVSWSGADPAPASGIVSYHVQYKINAGGTWTNWKTKTALTSAIFDGSPGRTYYFRARARDNAGNIGAWSAERRTIVPYNEGAGIISRSGFAGTYSKASSGFYKGTVRFSTIKGDSITYRFGGKSLALIGTKGRNRSKARIYIDGKYIKTVDPYASTLRYRKVLFQKTWLVGKKHTLRIVNVDNRTRLDIDGIGVGR